MARPYTADDFRAKVALIRSRLDRPALTTDIIVGFPGETEAVEEEAQLPRIVKTKQFMVKPMAPEEAALQLELGSHAFFAFGTSQSHGAAKGM